MVYTCSCSIGKSTGYKAKELASLVEGSSLLIGGKEIEVPIDIVPDIVQCIKLQNY